jgi:chaperonin GroES
MTMFETKEVEGKGLPEPCGWRVLVRIPEVIIKTEGGIYLPESLRDAEKILTVFAVVERLGPLAYTRNDMIASEPWCDPGDTVLISKYAGTRILVDGDEYRVINDDEVQAVIPDPSAVRRA